MFSQDQAKDVFAINQTAQIEKPKGWGLSNFMPGSSSNVSSAPPPAHSGSLPVKSNIHKTSFSAEDLFMQSPTKYSAMSSSTFNPVLPKSEPVLTSPTSSLLASYGITSPDLSKSHGSIQQTQAVSNINYDPVSPVSDSGQQNEHFNDMNLQEFAHIAQQKAEHERHQMLMHNKSVTHEIVHSRNNMGMGSNVRPSCNSPQVQSSHSVHSTPSPLQQPSPHSNSPHVQMSMGSPQNQVPSSTISATPPTIQAVPDSTTKPKKPRQRKKKPQREVVQDEKFPGIPHQQEMVTMHQNPQMMNMGGQYSPHTSYPYSPQKKSSSSSPQAPQTFSPQVAPQQSMMEGGYVGNMQRNVPTSPMISGQNPTMVNDQFGMQRNNVRNSSSSSAGNMAVHSTGSMSVASVNQVSVISDSNNRARVRSLQDIHENQGIGNSGQFGFTQQGRSFVQQLTTGNEMDMDKVGLEDPLGMQALGLAEGEGYSVSPQHGSVFTEVSPYESPYGYNESPLVQRSTSTIDEDALSSLIGQSDPMMHPFSKDSSPDTWQPHQHQQQHMKIQQSAPALAVTSHPEYDDDLLHLSKPPTNPEKKANPGRHDHTTPQMFPIAAPAPKPNPPPPPKVEIKKNPKNSGFMDSFLSFIQGKKPETLSSVNSAVVKRPELPKYIPEPPRKRPVESFENKVSSDSAASTPKPDSITSPSTSQNDSTMAFSDDEDMGSSIGNTVQNVITSLNEDGKPGIKMKISLGKGAKNVKSDTSAKTKAKKPRGPGRGRKKKARNFESEEEAYIVSSGDDDEYQQDSGEEDHIVVAPPSPTPQRRTSTRRAKEKSKYSHNFTGIKE